MGFRVISLQRLVNIHQLDVNFKKILTTYFEHLTSNQDTENDSLIPEDFTLEVIFYLYGVMSTFMIHYNNNNNAYCRAVNAETF